MMKSALCLLSIFLAVSGVVSFAPSAQPRQPSAVTSPLFRSATLSKPTTSTTTTTTRWVSSIPMEPVVDVAVVASPTFHPLERVRDTVSDATHQLNALRQKIAKSGVATAISYSFVSNVFTSVAVSLAWYGFSMQTGLSPIAPGQWKPFLAWYGGFYAVNSLLKPIRFMVALGVVAPHTERMMAALQSRFNGSKKASVMCSTALLVVTSSAMMASAIGVASLASGVPIFVSP